MEQTVREPLELRPSHQGRVVIVTGGAMGVGWRIVERFVAAGAAVAVADLNERAAQRAVEAVRRADGDALALPCDVTEADSVQEATACVLSHYGRADILVNNAGIFPAVQPGCMCPRDWERVQAVNLRGLWLFSWAFTLELARGGEGAIVNIGAVETWGFSGTGVPGWKGSGRAGLTAIRDLALELAPYNVRVNTLVPGPVTAGVGGISQAGPQVYAGDDLSYGADLIASATLVLASPLSPWATGCCLKLTS